MTRSARLAGLDVENGAVGCGKPFDGSGAGTAGGVGVLFTIEGKESRLGGVCGIDGCSG